jgi:hypothetical protein
VVSPIKMLIFLIQASKAITYAEHAEHAEHAAAFPVHWNNGMQNHGIIIYT